MTYKIATWNVLCDDYCTDSKADRYEQAAPEMLQPGARDAARIQRIAQLFEAGYQVVCLQEVGKPLLRALMEAVPATWRSAWGWRPDGAVIGVRGLDVVKHQSYTMPDREHEAIGVTLADGVQVVSVHVPWANHRQINHKGERAVSAVLAAIPKGPLALCGDFNADFDQVPQHPVRKACRKLVNPSAGTGRQTACIGGETKQLDYTLLRGLTAIYVDDDPLGLGPAAEHSDAPSLVCPSDHLPVGVHVTLK